MREPLADPFRRVDDDGQHRHIPAQRPEAIPMRLVIPVVAPDATQGRRACRAGLAQPPDELDVQRVTVVACLLARVDHELLPDAQAAGSLSGRCWGSASMTPSRLHTRTRSRVSSGPREHRAELREHAPHGCAVADGDDHQRARPRCARRTSRAGARRARCRRLRAARSPRRRRAGAGASTIATWRAGRSDCARWRPT